MNKTTYMNALRKALEDLPASVIEETVWAYESKFVDGMTTGKTEEEIAAGLPKPELVAAQKKASMRYDALKRNFTLGNVASLVTALIGLLVFNLFMLIPAIAYFSLLCGSYVFALGMYIAGIGITALNLSGVDEFSVELPGHRHMTSHYHTNWNRAGHPNVRVDITDAGILVDGEKFDEAASLPAAQANAATASMAAGSYETEKIHIEVDNHFSGASLLKGIGLLLGSILLFMSSMFITKYTFIGFKHYLRWNLAQLQLVRPA